MSYEETTVVWRRKKLPYNFGLTALTHPFFPSREGTTHLVKNGNVPQKFLNILLRELAEHYK
jgi:hypothetical protein